MDDLPDINVWVALALEFHIDHRKAREWFDAVEGVEVARFCRLTQMGFLRLVTHPRVLGERRLSPEAAWAAYDELRTDERIGFVEEPAGVEDPWRGWLHLPGYGDRLDTDLYLGAFAQAGGLRLVTLDRGFHAFPDLDCLVLD